MIKFILMGKVLSQISFSLNSVLSYDPVSNQSVKITTFQNSKTIFHVVLIMI